MVDDREALVAQVVALLQLPVGMEEVRAMRKGPMLDEE